MLPNKEKLEEIVKELQKIMRIQDWDIEIEYIDKYKMKHLFDSFDTAMLCERYRLRKEATIHVNVDHTALDEMWYESIVHELYHVVIGDITDMADDLMDELDVNEIVTRQKKQLSEIIVVNLAKVFSSIYPVTNFINKEVE